MQSEIKECANGSLEQKPCKWKWITVTWVYACDFVFFPSFLSINSPGICMTAAGKSLRNENIHTIPTSFLHIEIRDERIARIKKTHTHVSLKMMHKCARWINRIHGIIFIRTRLSIYKVSNATEVGCNIIWWNEEQQSQSNKFHLTNRLFNVLKCSHDLNRLKMFPHKNIPLISWTKLFTELYRAFH